MGKCLICKTKVEDSEFLCEKCAEKEGVETFASYLSRTISKIRDRFNLGD